MEWYGGSKGFANGNHERISEWKLKKSIELTRRSDQICKIFIDKLEETNEHTRKI